MILVTKGLIGLIGLIAVERHMCSAAAVGVPA